MKTKNFVWATLAAVALAGCSSDEFLGENSPNAAQENDGGIRFSLNLPNMTRAGEFIGATAADKLGGMFVVEGTKGSEQTNSPSTTVVFDNYLVGYTANSAGTTKSNTNNWEYVGLQSGITGKLAGTTWTALHNADGNAKSQTIKYWDYSQSQYDFIAWSTGNREAVTDDAQAGSKVKVTRINSGSTLATDGFTLTAMSADDLKECYYTDINKVESGDYGKPVTLTFKNMAAKVRVALYETVPGYSVKDVKFYSVEAANPTSPADLGTGTGTSATLFTTGSDKLPQSGAVTVIYPRIGSNNSSAVDYNKASVTVASVSTGATSTTQTFGALTNQYKGKEANEPAGNIYLGRNITEATFAGESADKFYTAVIPNTDGKALTLRVDYTLVPIDGAAEEIKVYGAKAVVPPTYTVWQPNYAYTYIFKISDNTNGWTTNTGTINVDNQGLYPITFDAVVTSFTDANAEQTTVTTVATPSITTYQQGHDVIAPAPAYNEYSKSQIAGADQTNVKDVYVQVMDNSGATPTLKADLNGAKKSRLYKITKNDVDYEASEAEVMDAVQNRTNKYSDSSASGRNGVKLAQQMSYIDNTVTEIVNGVDDQPITVTSGTAAKIDIDNDQLEVGTYAYVYAITVPDNDEVVYNVASVSTNDEARKYYEVAPADLHDNNDGTAQANNVYFVANRDANNAIVSYTFIQTKVGETLPAGLFYATIDTASASKATTYTAGHFYFDVYNRNNGKYAVKVIKVVN